MVNEMEEGDRIVKITKKKPVKEIKKWEDL